MNEATTRDLIRVMFARYRRRILVRGVQKTALTEERIRRLARRTMPRLGRGGRRRIGQEVQEVAEAIKRYLRWHIQRA